MNAHVRVQLPRGAAGYNARNRTRRAIELARLAEFDMHRCSKRCTIAECGWPCTRGTPERVRDRGKGRRA